VAKKKRAMGALFLPRNRLLSPYLIVKVAGIFFWSLSVTTTPT
jgi:hypothetical protein